MLPVHQLQGELAISVPRHRHPRDNHRGQGMVSVLLLLNVFLHIPVCPATLALNDLFAFLNILYCPRL